MVSITLLFGPLLIGVFLNAILYGIFILQLLCYFQLFKRDVPSMRYFTIFLFVAETVNTGFLIFLVFQPLILLFGQPEATLYFPFALPAVPITTVIISTPIQILFARRIALITKSRVLAWAISLLALVAFGGALWLLVTIRAVRFFAEKHELHWPALTWLLASVIADILIAIVLTHSLFRKKNQAMRADPAIARIIRLTIQTGIVTAVLATLDVICFLAFPDTTINFIWDFPLPKLYSNALLSTLNARRGREEMGTIFTTINDNVLFMSVGSECMEMGTLSIQAKGEPSTPHFHESKVHNEDMCARSCSNARESDTGSSSITIVESIK
ncbi:hypothetical protein JOM56_011801 [Amanita muscaria]